MIEALLAHKTIQLKAEIALLSRDPAALRTAMQDIAAIAKKQAARMQHPEPHPTGEEA